MKDILVFLLMGIVIYVVYRVAMKEPILPWKESTNKKSKYKVKSKKQSKNIVPLDKEPEIFQDLLKDIKEIDNHMIRHHDDTFVLISEVDPVNYFLLSDAEQEAIDVVFERWLAQISYNVKFYFQNRYIDLYEPIESMQKNMNEADDLHVNAAHFGKSLVEELQKWQQIAPRYETKRYLIFVYKVNVNDIKAEDADELEIKIVEKAFAELYRRFNTAKSQLRKARMDVQLLTSEGILDVLYHTFNRRKAVKNRFKDFGVMEMLAQYVTADQDDTRIQLVKEAIDSEFNEHDDSENEKEKAS